MTILNHSEHESVPTHHSAIEKLKDFALSCGWTVLDWRTNVRWALSGSQYDFVPGAESFLMLQSSGHGAQTLHFRLRGEAAGTNPNHEWVQIGSQKAGQTGLDHSSAVHPVFRNSWTPYAYNSFKPTDIPRMWLFGNGSFLMAVTQMNDVWCNMMAFGSVELFDVADDEGQFCGYGQDGNTSEWYEYTERDPFANASLSVFYDGYAKTNSALVHSMSSSFGGFVSYKDCTLRNLFSEVRPMFQGFVFVRMDSDSLWRPLGTFPVYRIHAEGLRFGEILTYGTKKFACFPSCRLNDSGRYYGIAARIE